jgi:hypothetical protein
MQPATLRLDRRGDDRRGDRRRARRLRAARRHGGARRARRARGIGRQEAVQLLSDYLRIESTNLPGNEIRAAQFFKSIFVARALRADRACTGGVPQPPGRRERRRRVDRATLADVAHSVYGSGAALASSRTSVRALRMRGGRPVVETPQDHHPLCWAAFKATGAPRNPLAM